MWYVMQVRATREQEILKLCEERVKRSGEEFFIMRCLRFYREPEGIWIKKEVKAFPGYIFIDTENIDEIRERLYLIPDLTKLLGAGDEIFPIYEDEENLLKLLGEKEHLIRASSYFKDGEKIIVTEGSLVGLEAYITWVNPHKKTVCIDVPLAGRVVSTKLAMEEVTRPEDVIDKGGS